MITAKRQRMSNVLMSDICFEALLAKTLELGVVVDRYYPVASECAVKWAGFAQVLMMISRIGSGFEMTHWKSVAATGGFRKTFFRTGSMQNWKTNGTEVENFGKMQISFR